MAQPRRLSTLMNLCAREKSNAVRAAADDSQTRSAGRGGSFESLRALVLTIGLVAVLAGCGGGGGGSAIAPPSGPVLTEQDVPVLKLTSSPSGSSATAAPGTGTGTGTSPVARAEAPMGSRTRCATPGTIAVANAGASNIVAFDRAGRNARVVAAGLLGTTAVACAPDGVWYAAVNSPGRLLRIDPCSGESTEIASGGSLGFITDLIIESPNTLLVTSVIDPFNSWLVRVSISDGTQQRLTYFGDYEPSALALSTKQNLVYVVLARDRRITLVDPLTGGTRSPSFTAAIPGDVDVALDGDVYYSDLFFGALVRVPGGTGSPELVHNDGPASNIRSLAVDVDGSVVAWNGTGLVRFRRNGDATPLWMGSPLDNPAHVSICRPSGP